MLSFVKVLFHWLLPPYEVYKEGGYVQIVEDCAKESMVAASQEVKALQQYARNGEV